MSKRRTPGEIVRRRAGSGFVGSEDPQLVEVPKEPKYTSEASSCMMGCGDDDCREWANLRVIIPGQEGEHGDMYHIAECEMDNSLLTGYAKSKLHPEYWGVVTVSDSDEDK